MIAKTEQNPLSVHLWWILRKHILILKTDKPRERIKYSVWTVPLAKQIIGEVKLLFTEKFYILANKDKMIELEYHHFAITVLMDFNIVSVTAYSTKREKITGVPHYSTT